MVTLAVCSVQHRLRNEEEKRQAAYLMVDHDEPLENNLAISSDLSLGIVMPSFMIEQAAVLENWSRKPAARNFPY